MTYAHTLYRIYIYIYNKQYLHFEKNLLKKLISISF